MAVELGALGGTRTPNLLIRSQMLYPLSYERRVGGGARPLPTGHSSLRGPPVRTRRSGTFRGWESGWPGQSGPGYRRPIPSGMWTPQDQ